jgi:hypothetical protein
VRISGTIFRPTQDRNRCDPRLDYFPPPIKVSVFGIYICRTPRRVRRPEDGYEKSRWAWCPMPDAQARAVRAAFRSRCVCAVELAAFRSPRALKASTSFFAVFASQNRDILRGESIREHLEVLVAGCLQTYLRRRPRPTMKCIRARRFLWVRLCGRGRGESPCGTAFHREG